MPKRPDIPNCANCDRDIHIPMDDEGGDEVYQVVYGSFDNDGAFMPLRVAKYVCEDPCGSIGEFLKGEDVGVPSE
jgi:hypothetical protein